MSDDHIPSSQPGSADPFLPVYRHAVPVGLVVAVVLVLLDQLTKQLAEALLVPGRFVPWLSDQIGWQLVYNPGGAFGIPAPHWIFLIVTVGVLVLVARVLPKAPSLIGAVAYGMLLSGAVGNVLDRLFRPGGEAFGSGFVVDFVAWGTFPRFNVADSAITVGFVLLVVAVLLEERRAAAVEEAERAADRGLDEPAEAPSDEPVDAPEPSDGDAATDASTDEPTP